MVWEHEYPVWEKYYPHGERVLDVGADPESVDFFKKHGAVEVYAIGDAYGKHVDAIKIDIDGGEWGMILETHEAVPRLRLLHDWKDGGARIYRLEKGRRIGRPMWKRFRIWLAVRRRLSMGGVSSR